ncbi:coiled-coil domain-containing protein 178 [Clinocottus analis]|uniref:coiled-coil domain-containing protein 178 n=1 Tax=Clinocottus analis TaxID=304258 RepID=UPI0035C0DEF9
MPDVEPLRFPSKEGRPVQQDQADLQAVCSGRRRRCALLNSPLPCVNNAIHHIQELKMTVENWCQQSGKYPPQINQEKHLYSKTLRYHSRDSDTESVSSVELFVEGIAISAQESCPLSPQLKKINDVLGEVVCLIERLEADRQYAEEALHKEKRRKQFLENQLDSICLWKQKESAILVQKEHEACFKEIAEQKWQLKLEREKLDQAQKKLSFIEMWNRSLHEDVNFAKKHFPIVKENLDHQQGIINQIKAAQAETDEVYSITHAEFLLVDNERKQMELDTSNQARELDQVLDRISKELANKLGDLNQLKILEKGIWAEITNTERTIALKEKKSADMAQTILELMECEKTENDLILQLELKIEDEMRKNKQLKEKLIALQENMEKTRLHGEAEVSCVEEQLLSKRDAFAALRKEIMECEQNVEDDKRKIWKSVSEVKQMQEEKRQMLQKIIDNDDQWEKAKEEMNQVVEHHSNTQTKLEEQEQQTLIEEQWATKEIETLRKHLTVQMTALELLKGHCAHKNEELYRHQRKSKLANQKLQEEFEEASRATQEMETNVGKLYKCTEHFEKMQCEHKVALVQLEKEKHLQRDLLKAAQDSRAAVIKRYDKTVARITYLTKNSEEYRDASDRMDKMAESIPEVLAELESVLVAMEFKNKSAALIMSTLQSDINNCQQRAQRSMQTHTAHITARKKQMEDTKVALILALKENQRLAIEYEGLQTILMEAKLEAVSALNEKNLAHRSLHYYTQLSLLQKRMHKALVKYFKQRSLYNQAELDRCQALSQETNQKIQTAEEGLSAEIQLIAAFLQCLTDDSTTTDAAGVNKQASPGSNE